MQEKNVPYPQNDVTPKLVNQLFIQPLRLTFSCLVV